MTDDRRLHVSSGVERREHTAGASRIDHEAKRAERALVLAKAHHAEMGNAMRLVTGKADFVVAGWDSMPPDTRDVMVEVMRSLLDKGVIV